MRRKTGHYAACVSVLALLWAVCPSPAFAADPAEALAGTELLDLNAPVSKARSAPAPAPVAKAEPAKTSPAKTAPAKTEANPLLANSTVMGTPIADGKAAAPKEVASRTDAVTDVAVQEAPAKPVVAEVVAPKKKNFARKAEPAKVAPEKVVPEKVVPEKAEVVAASPGVEAPKAEKPAAKGAAKDIESLIAEQPALEAKPAPAKKNFARKTVNPSVADEIAPVAVASEAASKPESKPVAAPAPEKGSEKTPEKSAVAETVAKAAAEPAPVVETAAEQPVRRNFAKKASAPDPESSLAGAAKEIPATVPVTGPAVEAVAVKAEEPAAKPSLAERMLDDLFGIESEAPASQPVKAATAPAATPASAPAKVATADKIFLQPEASQYVAPDVTPPASTAPLEPVQVGPKGVIVAKTKPAPAPLDPVQIGPRDVIASASKPEPVAPVIKAAVVAPKVEAAAKDAEVKEAVVETATLMSAPAPAPAPVPAQNPAPMPVAAPAPPQPLQPVYLSPSDVIASQTPPQPVQMSAPVLPEVKATEPVVAAAPDLVPPSPLPEPAAAPPVKAQEPAPEPEPGIMPTDMVAMVGSNFDPEAGRAAAHPKWRATRGQTLREVLESWCDQNNVQLVWDSQYDYPLQAAVAIDDNFENAVRTLLEGFAKASPQPIGRLHRQAQVGESILVIETRGNRYRN